MKISRQDNTRKQGDQGMGIAIAWFTCNNYTVCIPLTDSQQYDLIVDKDNIISRVFVRTTTQVNKFGKYQVGLRTSGGNKSHVKVTLFDKTCVELLFIVSGNGECYLIPSNEIECTTGLYLSKKYEKYIVYLSPSV